ncbi:MAG: hypothetical protein HC877_01860 [Thioploca sp.]|nr:hypothetical protein [Thioploca sp.]
MMQNFSLEMHIGADGILHLDLPMAVKNMDLKVTVMCKPLSISLEKPLHALTPTHIEEVIGCLPYHSVAKTIEEMNAAVTEQFRRDWQV